MMMIQGTPIGDIGVNNAAGTDIRTADVTLWPADRCTWTQVNPATSNAGYSITNAYFWPGASVAVGTTVTNVDAISITNPRLGFIGKTGRFVEIAG